MTAPQLTSDTNGSDDRVPFWIVLAGVGVGAFWALAGVGVGSWVSRRRELASGSSSADADHEIAELDRQFPSSR